MARFAHTAPRTRRSGSVAVWTILLAVLATLLGSSALGSQHPRASKVAVAAAEAASAHSEPYADRADPAVSTVSVRSHRDGAGQRHAPPVSTPGALPGTGADPFRLALPPPSAIGPPASEQRAHRYGVRAPPALSGT